MSFQTQDEQSSESTITKSQISNDKLIKIKRIIENHFNEEINYKKLELETIDDRIFQAKNTLDKLRVCIICKFYSLDGNLAAEEYKNHPTIRQLKCEHLELAATNATTITSAVTTNEQIKEETKPITREHDDSILNSNSNDSIEKSLSNYKQFTLNLNVGNVSKYLKASTGNQVNDDSIESSQYNQDLITHKWMIYIRSANCPKLENYIKKVIFYLHSSYKPYDIVEVKTPPFQLIRRGWGEFPIHVQIHFKDARNKRVDVNHLLKLDWTQTGLQTFGGETSQEIQLILKQNDFVSNNSVTVSKTNTNESDIINNQSLFANEPKDEPILTETKQEYVKPVVSVTNNPVSNVTSSLKTSLNDLFNLRPKIAQPINLNQTTIKSVPIIINNNDSKINENSAKAITSKLGLNSLLTAKITSPLTGQIVLNKPATVMPELPINKPNNIINKIQSKLIDDKTTLPILNKTQIIYKVNSTDAKLNKQETEPKLVQQITKVVTNDSAKRKLSEDEQSNEKKLKSNHINNQVITNETKLNEIDLKSNQLIYTVDYLIDNFTRKINTNNESFSNNKFELLVKQSLKFFPLVLNFNIESTCLINNRRRNQLGFCARTLNEFYSWPYAKRKANEWLRALNLRRFILENNELESVWSTKEILLYLRSHGYTPLENQHINKSLHPDPNNFHYVSSLTPINRLLKKHFNTIENSNDSLTEIDDSIDIITTDSSVKKLKRENHSHDVLNKTNENKIELCQGSKYIREQLDLLNIKTSNCTLIPSDEPKPTETNVFSCNLVEKFLFTVFRRFADDLIRQTCADIYFNKNNKLSQLNNKNLKKQQTNGLSDGSELILSQKFPTSLSVVDVYNTIRSHDKFDFLTNKYMASMIKIQSNKESSDFTSTIDKPIKSDVNIDPNDQMYKNNSKKIIK